MRSAKIILSPYDANAPTPENPVSNRAQPKGPPPEAPRAPTASPTYTPLLAGVWMCPPAATSVCRVPACRSPAMSPAQGRAPARKPGRCDP